MKSTDRCSVTGKITGTRLGSQSTFLFHREALPLQLVSHLTDYLLHEKFQSGLRAGPSPEASVEFVIIYLL